MSRRISEDLNLPPNLPVTSRGRNLDSIKKISFRRSFIKQFATTINPPAYIAINLKRYKFTWPDPLILPAFKGQESIGCRL